MNKKLIKKLIIEALSQVYAGQTSVIGEPEVMGTRLQQDISLLKDYTQISNKIIDGAKTWKFEYKTDDSSYLSHIFVVQYPKTGLAK
ncbi:MAG: hypothetical protein Q8O88_03615 [bacterium]|nr:hypothetical protein [bacterium]